MRTSTLIGGIVLATAGSLAAQNLQIQNLSSNWSFDYNSSTGVISNVLFKPAEGDGVDITDNFVVSWGVQSDANDPSSYTELARQTVTQGLPAFNAITVNNWSAQDLNQAGIAGGNYYVTVVVDTDDDISETNENDNALFLATDANDTFVFTPNSSSLGDANGKRFKAYPNPAVDVLHVELQEKAEQLVLYAMNGKRVWTRYNPMGLNQAIDMRSLASGTYILVVKDARGEHITRVVKP